MTGVPLASASMSPRAALSGPSDGAQYTPARRNSAGTASLDTRPWKVTPPSNAGGTSRA